MEINGNGKIGFLIYDDMLCWTFCPSASIVVSDLIHFSVLGVIGGRLYGKCWVTAWTTDWSPEARIESAMGAQVKAIHPCDQKGWSLAPPLLDPHLRADCHWGRMFFWKSFPLEFYTVSLGYRWAFHLFLIVSFCHTNLSNYKPVKYNPNHTTLLTVLLLIVQKHRNDKWCWK